MNKTHNKLFKRIGITIKKNNQDANRCAQALIKFLVAHAPNIDLFLHGENGQNTIDHPKITVLNLETICSQVDLIICIGGDGTLIRIAHCAVVNETPVLGVNLGHLGYLTDILPSTMEKEIQAIFRGDYSIEKRLMLQTNINQQKLLALNEFLIRHRDTSRMIDIKVEVDDRRVIQQKSDGLLISTPTGSTAYALSAGGPIISPKLKAISITPICPHTLSYRPLILHDSSVIKLTPSSNHNIVSECCCDGRQSVSLAHTKTLVIQKHHQHLLLMHPTSHDEFETLRNKLQWG